MLSDDQYAGGGTKAIDMFSRLLNHSSQLVMDGVKNLVIKRHNLPVTKVVDVLMEQKTSPSEIADEYRYFDPKLLRSTDRLARFAKSSPVRGDREIPGLSRSSGDL